MCSRIGEEMGRKCKNVINKHKKCSTKYCNNKPNTYGTDNYCKECRKYLNHKRELKKKNLWGGNYLYVYFSSNNVLNSLYVGLTHNYVERHEEHLRGDKVFIKEELWHKRVVYKLSDDINHKELEFLEYKLIQFCKNRSKLLTNDKKMKKRIYDNIPQERQTELNKMLATEIKSSGFFVDVNKNYNAEKMEMVDINYLQNKKILLVCKHEELEKVI